MSSPGGTEPKPRPPKLPDLDRLTDLQKRQLIVSLWETLLAMDARDERRARDRPSSSAVARQRSAAEDDSRLDTLRARIRSTAPSRRAFEPAGGMASPGSRLRFLKAPPLMLALVVVGLVFLVDAGVGYYQQRTVAARERAALALRRVAFEGLFAELIRANYEEEGAYKLTLRMQPLDPAAPIYVLLNPVRVFVQQGLAWQEMPTHGRIGGQGGVVKLTGAHDYAVSFRVSLKDWSQLIPGYMHVLVESGMMISLSDAPTDDLVERANRFYIYLKPQDADDEAIRQKSHFRGKPPIFIPMPPH